MYWQVVQALLRQSTWKDTMLHWRCYSLRCLDNTSWYCSSMVYKCRPQVTLQMTWSRYFLRSTGVCRPYVCRANRADARFVDHRAKKVFMVEMSALGWTTAQRKRQRRLTSMGHWDWNYQENTQGNRSLAKRDHWCDRRMVQRSREARRWQTSLEKQESMFWRKQY